MIPDAKESLTHHILVPAEGKVGLTHGMCIVFEGQAWSRQCKLHRPREWPQILASLPVHESVRMPMGFAPANLGVTCGNT